MTLTRASYNYNLYEQYFATTENQAEYTPGWFWYSEREVSGHLIPVLTNAPPGNCWAPSPPTPTEDVQIQPLMRT